MQELIAGNDAHPGKRRIRRARHLLRKLSLLIFLLGPRFATAQDLDATIKSLWKVYTSIPADSTLRSARVLLHIASCYRLTGHPGTEDSIGNMLVARARMADDERVTMEALNMWFASRNDYGMQASVFSDLAVADKNARTMMAIASHLSDDLQLSRAWGATAMVAMDTGFCKEAVPAADKAYYYASLTDDEGQKVHTLLLLYLCEIAANEKLEGFRHLMDALYIAQQKEDIGLQATVYEKLTYFHLDREDFQKAENYLYKLFALFNKSSLRDSSKLAQYTEALSILQCAQHAYALSLQTARGLLQYCYRTHHYYFKDDLLNGITYWLINANQCQSLADLYRRDFPQELLSIRHNDLPFYHQLRAVFAIADGSPDSALYYYRLAESGVRASSRGAGARTSFYDRYANALISLGQPSAAIAALDSGLRYATWIQYLPFMAQMSGLLDSLCAATGNIPAAYHYAHLNKIYTEALRASNRQDEILSLSLESELRSRELFAQQEEARIEHRHVIQYYLITLLIGISFAMLVMLGVFRVPQWLISAMGFFSFIFLFEFIILLIDHKVHELTHGEPWMVLGIKIIIIAGLLPLHHWLEHKVVHYLHHHHLTTGVRRHIGPLVQKIRGIAKRKVTVKAAPVAAPLPKKPQ